MKAIIMAAGYAVRLYPLTENQPKPLLPINGKPIIEYIIEKIDVFSEIDEIYVVTNNKFYPHFLNWVAQFQSNKKIEILNDGTLSAEDRLGAIGDIDFTIRSKKINDDLLIIAGDNLFDFSLNDVKEFFNNKDLVICAFDVGDNELSKKYGILSVNGDGKVYSFVEKPSNPPSTLAALGIYLFKKDKLNLIEKYLSEGNNKDAPGFFIQWVYKVEDVYAYVFNGNWYDIGDMISYKKADEFFRN